jgi:hypothetical protein
MNAVDAPNVALMQRLMVEFAQLVSAAMELFEHRAKSRAVTALLQNGSSTVSGQHLQSFARTEKALPDESVRTRCANGRRMNMPVRRSASHQQEPTLRKLRMTMFCGLRQSL